MDWNQAAASPCAVQSTLVLVGDRWSLLIIRDVMNGVRRFDELVARLEVSRATLSDRLRRLVGAGILETSEYTDDRGRLRIEYRMTERGWDLRNVVIALREWGDRHVLGAGNEPIDLVDRTSGDPVRLALVSQRTGEVVTPDRIRVTPGPGFRARSTG